MIRSSYVVTEADGLALKFPFYEKKAVEALAYIAHAHSGLTPLYVSKIVFFAEKWHLNKFGRPIFADTYIAMPLGPVPSTVKNFIDHNWDWIPKPEEFDDAVVIDRAEKIPRLMPGNRKPDMTILSQTDVECLDDAIAFCANMSASQLSSLTHSEKAWMVADANQPMDYEMFIDDDNPHKLEIMSMARELAVHGVF